MTFSKYQLDANSILVPREEQVKEFQYSDGDEAEERILNNLQNARDLSLASDELRCSIRDWPSEYHFSAARSNLLSFMDLYKFGSILEVGSGCGAITRLLGEKGNDVLALEGSYRRARITQSRCNDLNNVKVCCDSLEGFQSDEKFDLVTLIGVLEYSSVFFSEPNPIQKALLKAGDLLADEGMLVIAIENQLGLKYFNACSEDHTSELFYGINDLYEPGEAITFGKREIEDQIRKAGFDWINFIYPFPDYKLPRLLVREANLEEDDLDMGMLIGQFSSRDYLGSDQRLFIENRVWPVINRNHLIPELANSFLIFTGKGESVFDRYTDQWLVKSFSSERRKKYLTENTFSKKASAVVVDKINIFSETSSDSVAGESERLVHHTGTTDYIAGMPYAHSMPSRLFKGDPVEQYLDYLKPWVEFLKQEQTRQNFEELKLPGDYLDCRPDNLIITPGSGLKYFDNEWESKKPVSTGFVIFRSILHDILARNFWYRKAGLFGKDSVRQWLNDLFVRLDQAEIIDHFQQYLEEEIRIQSEVTLETPKRLAEVLDGFLSNPAEKISSVSELLNSDDKLREAVHQVSDLTLQHQQLSEKLFQAEKRNLMLDDQNKVLTDQRRVLTDQNRALTAHARDLNLLNEDLRRQVESLTQMIHDIWAGWSWKIGRIFTYIPRKTKLLLYKLKDRLVKKRAEVIENRETNAYANWYREFIKVRETDRERINNLVSEMDSRPLISIIMPVYNTPEKWLKCAIDSVLNQLYQNWELCIADDASDQPHIKRILKDYQSKDSRIKVCFRENNGHISNASNSALELATGDYIALMDHDDEITEDALFCIASEINGHPNTTLIYSDEDKIDPQGVLSHPYFKPDWSPDLLLSHNYFCHFTAIKKTALMEIGGFRPGFEGAQDWDLFLRIAEQAGKDEIRHIPRILYHWRMIEGSTSSDLDNKNYAMTAGIKAVQETLERRNLDARAIGDEKSAAVRVIYNINPEPRVSLIILTRDKLSVLEKCVSSILEKTDYSNFEIVIVDNNSREKKTLEYLAVLEEQNRNVRILKDNREFNFPALNNSAVKETDSPIIGLVNNDIEVISSEWLRELVSHAQRREIGASGARLLYPDNTIQHAGVITGIQGVAGHAFKHFKSSNPGANGRAMLIQNFSAVTAACIFFRREVFDEVGGMDENNLAIAFNDIDFCLRIREAGYRIVYSPYAELYHHESISRGYEDTPEKQQRFAKEISFMKDRWGQSLVNDPYYNPNLTLGSEDFSLAEPPRSKH